jgi:hypothetical protein
MVIKINEGFHTLVDIESLSDNEKLFAAYLSEIYTQVESDTYLFFVSLDLRTLLNLHERWDPTRAWTKKRYPNLFKMYDWVFLDYNNIGVRPKYIRNQWANGLTNPELAKEPLTSTEITEPRLEAMWWYLLGTLAHNPVSEFGIRETMNVQRAFRFHRDYIIQLDEQWEIKERKKKDVSRTVDK